MGFKKVSRRRFVGGTAALSTAMVAAPFVRGAYAAGKLSLGLWDHWVPNANGATEKLIKEWGEKEKVEVQIDFITSQGNKLLLTTAAESQAKSGHDIIAMNTFLPARYAEQLVPVNAEMDKLIADNGKVNDTVEYLGKIGGKWLAIPATIGSQIKGPCSRIDYMKEYAKIDVQAMYPAGAEPKDKDWTLDAFMKAAEACHKGGHPFGIGLGTTSDCVDTIGAIFHSFGAVLVDAKGEIVVKNDQVRQALDWYKKLMAFLPEDVPAWDDSSNNKFLVSGQASMIMNPPSAWAVAKRDAPKVAENCWTHGFPSGPKGRFGPFLPFFWGIWNFSKNVPAAKSLLMYMSQASSAEKMVEASGGYDLPAFEKLTKFKVWAEAEPPKGTLFHYPDPYHHQTLSIAAAPAPHKIAEQIYNLGLQTQMAVRYFKGEPLEKTLDWASNELEGFMRN
ncbi:extracellular solute-binding protein [Enhydrobacter sp.]|jgi:ABC-type glycerol-3-phosphate transport system substrate-binding protein|uniref:ABC transporter substrate-binding protein n=1 Tax=Enhydrobacter sp. TaxID=1894999 RepID=UPI00260A211C|nr:extracellular solute-binding protein [Enhydrobacter sp.]WIM13475.1 MAG: ABC transporter, substrate-binding protein (cluster 1, maltose/g3p/polyamine/iron) [Enhydrobacter sp.]